MRLSLNEKVKPRYRSLNLQNYCDKQVSIRPISLCEVIKIRVWRNEQISVLRQRTHISLVTQIHYFFSKIRPERGREKPNQILFSIWLNREFVAYGGLVHIDWPNSSGELSFLHKFGENSKEYREILKVFVGAICNFYSTQMQIKVVFTETFEFRKLHIGAIEHAGFIYSGKTGTLKGMPTLFHSIEI